MEERSIPDRSFLDRLFEAFSEAASQNDDSLRESLVDDGIDPDQVTRRGLQLVRDLSRQQRLIVARTRLDLIRQAIDLSAKRSDSITGDIRRAIVSALAGGQEGLSVQAYFHKLESVEQEDLQSLVDDTMILDLLDKLDVALE